MSNHLHQWWDWEHPVTTDSVAVDLGLDLGLFVPLVMLGFDLFAGISGLSSLSLELVLDLDLLLKLDPSNSSSLIVDGSSTSPLSDISPSKSVESKSCACLLVNNWCLGRVELPDYSWVGVSNICLLWKPTFSYKKNSIIILRKMITIEK